MRMLMPTHTRTGVAICFLLLGLFRVNGEEGNLTPPPPELEPADGVRIEVDPCHTFVTIAKVNLDVSPLFLRGDELVGTYAIDVPIRKSKSEGGSIILNLEFPFEQLMANGGVLEGEGTSFKRDGEERGIICRIDPGDDEDLTSGSIEIQISTPARVMSFETTYRLLGDVELKKHAVAQTESPRTER